jgi:hypothetical protein
VKDPKNFQQNKKQLQISNDLDDLPFSSFVPGESLNLNVKGVVEFESIEKIPLHPGDNQGWLLLPKITNFMGWDCIYTNGEDVALFQFCKKPDNHHLTQMEKALIAKDSNSESLIEKILNRLFGKKISLKIGENKIETTPEFPGRILCFCVCSSSETVDLIGTGEKKSPIWKVLQIYGRETCEEYGVVF